MNTIIPTWIFYIIAVLSNIRIILIAITPFLAIGLFAIAYFSCGLARDRMRYGKNDNDFKDGKNILLKCKKRILIVVILLLLTCFIPSEKTMYTMLANNYITYDNVEAFKGNAKELTDYVFEKIGELKETE